MTGLLVRFLPRTRRHEVDGASFVMIQHSANDRLVTGVRSAHRSALEPSSDVVFCLRRHRIAEVPRPGHENRRLNAHVPSAVPLNRLFPHS